MRLGGTEILRGIDLELRAGEIHALIGPNGSGKTTALRVLAGELRAAAGRVEARRARSSAPRLPVALAAARSGSPLAVRARWRTSPARCEPGRGGWALALTGWPLAPATTRHAGAASAGCCRSRARRPPARRVLALDEPAAGMAADERDRLVAILRALADERPRACSSSSTTCAWWRRAADVVTVLDEGAVIAHGDAGRGDRRRRRAQRLPGSGRVILSVRELRAGPLRGVSLEVAAGEVVAVVGHGGAGKTTLAEVVAGLRHAEPAR